MATATSAHFYAHTVELRRETPRCANKLTFDPGFVLIRFVEGPMKNPTTSVRDRLAGKPLIGFNTKAPRLPAAMVGAPTVKPAR